MNDNSSLATYRLQFNHSFRLTDAQVLVSYFSRLGITHLYASPILRAREASTHGYDTVDPKMVNPNIGTETDLANLVTDLRKLSLGLILDIVPNHVAASIENPYWRDVLTYGPSSPFARWFDIDWRMPDPELWGRVLVPVFGEPRSKVLEQNQIRVVWADGRFLVQYFDHIFPIDPTTVPSICTPALSELEELLPAEHPTLAKISGILGQLKKLPSLATRLQRRVNLDREGTEQLLSEFAQLVVQSPRIQEWAEKTAERFGQGEAGRRSLQKLLDNQPYRLVFWREAARTINYRRFFDINELISIRQEDPQVFDETHATVLRWVSEGSIDGLRIDHVDGLRDPLGYLERLSESLAGTDRSRRTLPVFVEKILAPDEKLPCGWPVTGTTGYEFLNQAEAVFASPSGFAQIEEQYRRMLRRPVNFEEIAVKGKRRVLRHDLSPHVGRLADTLVRLAESARKAPSAGEAAQEPVLASAEHAENSAVQSSPANELQPSNNSISQSEPTKRDFVEAIVEVITALPVYRTYVDSQYSVLSEADRQYVTTALESARGSGRTAPEAIDFLAEVLLLENKSSLSDRQFQDRVNFVQRFQQLTGPAAAKGIEDTALYSYVPLVSLNEVGGEPLLPEDPVGVLHHANEQRAATRPQTMLCVTTHDTKRTADVRARLDVLSELPKLWSGLVRRWQRFNRPHGSQVAKKHAPDAVTEYLCYQTLVGVWPAADPNEPSLLPPADVLEQLKERIEQYMVKAMREAKTHTSWTNNNEEYENAVLSFVGKLFEHGNDTPFLSDVQNLVARIARPGFWNSLSRTLVQFTCPGTPDLYQGDELWNFALVDPDNRRPVDYELRQRLLDEVITGVESSAESRREYIRNMVESPECGRIKLHVIHRALAARREHSSLFTNGQYVPLAAEGPAQDHVLAFARVADEGGGDAAAITVVPRLTASLASGSTAAPIGEAVWSDTVLHLPKQLRSRTWACALTRQPLDSASEGTLPIAQVLESFPGALLIGTNPQHASE